MGSSKSPRLRDDSLDPQEEQPGRYIVGIDLGTTNSAVAYVDTAQEPWRVQTLPIPQLVDLGQHESRDSLPSFHYQPLAEELAAVGSPAERNYLVGVLARDLGVRNPSRLVVSAKSWLCHSGVDRTADLLPWQSAADVVRISPVEASARYLRLLRDAWETRFPAEPLAAQDLVLTLPASFDEVARELTVQAAATAGLPRVVLIEEPQAAFYAWINAHPQDWQQRVLPGQKILVCDIGGGTSDFTLIRVRQGQGERVQFHRVAVGEHLILGGDNLDLALARHIEQQLGKELEPHAWSVLVRICRRLKEDLLHDACPETVSFNLPGTGARLIGGGQRVVVDREEARHVLIEGFFPHVSLNDRPRKQTSGFREFGLPYAPDAAVTRYLAAFLVAHRWAGEAAAERRDTTEQGPAQQGRAGEDPAGPGRAGQGRAGQGGADQDRFDPEPDPARPDIVLFNGGLFNSPLIRRRLIQVVQSWFDAPQTQWSPTVLEPGRLDLAVATGAAYYGTVRRGRGVRIAAGLARSYYVGIESEPPAALCLVPGNVEPGQQIDLDQHPFELRVQQPVEFPLYVSSLRLADPPGEVLPVDVEQMKPLPPIRTVLRTRQRQASAIPVTLHARLTEIGTLELWCSQVGTEHSWRLQFDIRSATQTDLEARQTAGEAEGVLDEASWQACYACLADTFGSGGTGKPAALVRQLSEALAMGRWDWPMPLLRRIWEALFEFQSGREKSPAHEQRWLNLLGFALRPGFGMAVDDWRVTQTWRAVQGRLIHATAASRTESWILWRRISGGLSAGQQRAIADPLLASVRGLRRRLTKGGGDFGFTPQESIEMWRLLGAFELLDLALKTELGDLLIELKDKRPLKPARDAMTWAVGRIGSRVPVYGPLNQTVPTQHIPRWLTRLMQNTEPRDSDKLAVLQLARRTDDRYRDLPEKLRREVAAWLEDHAAPQHFQELVRHGGSLDREEQGRVMGEALPKGLRIQ